ncbi:MAG: GtrA family protein [Anaerolineaceae bacterium]|nr:GtrA family protein [Anaerolineaceae bacterium]MBN2677478.1 GtrA family protein [Anaerolineaceae bacterium]
MLTKKKERTRFLRFCVVGAIGAVVDFGVFNVLTHLTTMQPVVASIISFTAAVSSNFLWNRYWTYPDSRTKHVSHQIIQFFMINIIGLIIRTPLFAFLEPHLVQMSATYIKQLALPSTTIGYNLSLAIAVGVVLLWNFFANRYWTYSDVSSD